MADWNFVKRISRYFCISSQALHSTAPSGSLSSKSEWLTMHDIAWCTMVLVLPCFIYVMPSIRIARNCMITPKLLHPCACIVKATIYKCTVAADLGPELLADLFIAICSSLASVLLCFATIYKCTNSQHDLSLLLSAASTHTIKKQYPARNPQLTSQWWHNCEKLFGAEDCSWQCQEIIYWQYI